MANWLDFISLVVTIAFFGGTIYGIVYVVGQVSSAVQSTKEKLKEKGLDISDKGVSLKTSKRFNREDYIDATQRGLIKTMSAASFGTADSPVKTPVLSRENSATRAEKERKHLLGSRKDSQ